MKNYDFVGPFCEGRAKVRIDNKWGFITENGKEIVPCSYDAVEDFIEDRAAVKLDGKWGFIDETDYQFVRCKYDYVDNFINEYARVSKNGKYGIVHKNGSKTVPCRYDFIDNFSEGRAMVALGKITSNKYENYGFVDEKGFEIVPPIYATKEMAESQYNNREKIDEEVYIKSLRDDLLLDDRYINKLNDLVYEKAKGKVKQANNITILEEIVNECNRNFKKIHIKAEKAREKQAETQKQKEDIERVAKAALNKLEELEVLEKGDMFDD